MTETELLGLLARKVLLAGSQSVWAKDNNMSAAYVSDVLNGRRAPGEKILEVLNVERVITYRRKQNNVGQ